MAGFLRGVTELTLSFGGVTATITDTQRGGYSRTPLPGQADQVEKRLNNNTVVSGSRNQVDYQWDLTFHATNDTVIALEDIHRLSKNSPAPECDLVDLLGEVVDDFPITRLTAPSPNDAVTPLSSGGRFYFATFKVIITDINTRGRSLGRQPDGTKLWEVSLSLEEGDESA